jgi:diacylglycerol kinase family enzyme
VRRYRVPWVEWESETKMPINLDGEPIYAKKIRFEVLPEAINLVLNADCPMIKD